MPLPAYTPVPAPIVQQINPAKTEALKNQKKVTSLDEFVAKQSPSHNRDGIAKTLATQGLGDLKLTRAGFNVMNGSSKDVTFTSPDGQEKTIKAGEYGNIAEGSTVSGDDVGKKGKGICTVTGSININARGKAQPGNNLECEKK